MASNQRFTWASSGSGRHLIMRPKSMLATATWIQAQQRKNSVPTNDFVELQRLLWTNHMGYDFAQQDNGDLWLSSFTPDAVLENGSDAPITGLDKIRQFATRNDPGRTMRHWTSTFYATPNAEGAVLSAFFIGVTKSRNGGLQMGRTGYYESQAVKTKDGWKLKHHVVHQEGDIVVPKDPPGGFMPRPVPSLR